MRRELLNILACPRCGGKLKVEEPIYKRGHIWEGKLICRHCNSTFPIKGGVPRLMITDDDDMYFIARAYGYLFSAYFKGKFEKNTLYGATEEEEVEKFFSALGITPEELKGKRVLDVGCGAGRLVKNLGRYGAEVVGIDIHTALEIPFQQCLEQSNVHIVQADLNHLPFSEKFDIIWCEGVLSYIQNPRKGFSSLCSFLKENGRIYVWISRKSRRSFINRVRRFLKSSYRYPPLIIYIVSKLLAIVYIIGVFLVKRKNFMTKYRYLSFLYYNALLRKYEHDISLSEVKQWFEEEGLKVLKVSEHGVGVTGVKIR